MLVSGAVPLWDRSRVLQAVTGGEAKQVEGSVHNWRIVRIRGRRYSTGGYPYRHYESFSVGDVAFKVEWGALETGFTNRSSHEEKPAIRTHNSMLARD